MTANAPDVPSPKPVDVYRLEAMEVWGGNEGAEQSVSVTGFDINVICRPHQGHASGGDLRYVSMCAAGQIGRFTLADISGHGQSAGDAALALRALMRKHVNTPNPTRFAVQLNTEFARLAEGGVFATALITTYFAPTDHFIVCNAGHPRPLLYRSASRTWELMDPSSPKNLRAEHAKESGISNLPLGIIEPANYPQFATRLVPGDIVVLYTDSLIESANSSGTALGEEGLLDLVRSLDLTDSQTLARRIENAVSTFRGHRPSDDDTTLMVLRHNGSDPVRMPLGVKLKTLGKLVGLVRS